MGDTDRLKPHIGARNAENISNVVCVHSKRDLDRPDRTREKRQPELGPRSSEDI